MDLEIVQSDHHSLINNGDVLPILAYVPTHTHTNLQYPTILNILTLLSIVPLILFKVDETLKQIFLITYKMSRSRNLP